MRNILNYQTAEAFEDGGNIAPMTWYCGETEFGNGRTVMYWAEYEPGQSLVEKQYKGRVVEIVPGVAYINESGLTVYNKSKFPEISATTQTRVTNWEEFGITQELYDKYRSAIINREFPQDFNATIGGSQCGSAGLHTPSGPSDNEYLILGCGNYEYEIFENGTVEILSNIA